MFPISTLRYTLLRGVFALCCITACAPLPSGDETAMLPAETPVSDATPTPWMLFDPKDADVNWYTQTPTPWPKLSRADCERGLCPPTPTPWPLPPADIMLPNLVFTDIVAYPGQTIAITNHFHQHAKFWGAISGEYGPDNAPIIKVVVSPSFTAASYTRYWLFQAMNPGKIEVGMRRVDLHCHTPSECLPEGWRLTFVVLPAPSPTPEP